MQLNANRKRHKMAGSGLDRTEALASLSQYKEALIQSNRRNRSKDRSPSRRRFYQENGEVIGGDGEGPKCGLRQFEALVKLKQ